MNTILQDRHIEIHQKSKPNIGELQIGSELRFMDWFDPFNCFQFYNDQLVDHYIKSIATIQPETFIYDGKWFLPLAGYSL
jgi:hypothetical protein